MAGQGTFKVELLTPELVEQAIALRDGTAVDRQTPIGTIVDGDGGVNAPWHWHLDPASVEFVDVAMEVCDGLPSHVEDGTLTSTSYCPWGPKVISVTPRSSIPTRPVDPTPWAQHTRRARRPVTRRHALAHGEGEYRGARQR